MHSSSNTLNAIGNRLKTKRKLFYWTLPICLIVCYLLLFCVPNTYVSSISLTVENQRNINEYSTLTLNHPADYDLGLSQTRNAITEYAYEDIVHSYQFLQHLYDAPVQTVEGDFSGTYADYLYLYTRKPLRQHVMGFIRRLITWTPADRTPVTAPAEALSLSRKQAGVLANMRQQISCKVDPHTDIVRIEVETQDPMVSTQVAQYIEQELHLFTQAYQEKKMQAVLDRLATLTEKAHADWQNACSAKDKNSDTYKQIYDSFCRQQVIYQAQMMPTPSFLTLTDPVLSYQPAGPHRVSTSLLLTIVVGLCMVGWICRREIIEAL